MRLLIVVIVGLTAMLVGLGILALTVHEIGKMLRRVSWIRLSTRLLRPARSSWDRGCHRSWREVEDRPILQELGPTRS